MIDARPASCLSTMYLSCYFKTFVGIVQDFTWFGLFKAIGSIGFSELIGKPLAAQFQAHHFNRLYSGDASFVGFREQRDKWGSGGGGGGPTLQERGPGRVGGRVPPPPPHLPQTGRT